MFEAGHRIVHGADIVDLSINPGERKMRRRLHALHLEIPILAVALLVGAILGIALFSYESNRRGASVLSDDLLRSLEKRISAEVETYLEPAPEMAHLVRQTLGGDIFDAEGIERAETFGRHVLRAHDQIASLYVADGAGRFLMISRNADGGTDTKLIDIASDGTQRHVRLIRRDAGENILDQQELQDDFDPRTRPWYRGAVSSGNMYWTDVYIFFTERTPGLTVALPVVSADGSIAAVYGIDITLAALSKFLKGIEIGETGRAMIIDAEGRLIAADEPERVLRDDNGVPTTRRLDELGDVGLTRAFNHFRIRGHGHGTIDVDGERIIYAATALPIAADKSWSVLIVVPEREIIGFVAANNQTSLLLSLSIIGIAILLAALLAREGIRADRNARVAKERQGVIESQSRAFTTLANSAALFNPDDGRCLSALSESLAEVTNARRISIWRLTRGGRSLLCEECYDRESNGHTASVELHCTELSQLWTNLQAGNTLDVVDAAQDIRASGLRHAYLQPLGVGALMALPIQRGSDVIGSLWLEDLPPVTHRPAGVETFARAVAQMLAARFAVQAAGPGATRAVIASKPAQQRVAAPAPDEKADPSSHRVRQDRVVPGPLAALRETAVDGARLEKVVQRNGREGAAADAVEVYPTVTILTVLLPDTSSADKPADDAGATAADAVARALEDAAHSYEIPYLKVLGNNVVAAGGFSGDPILAARSIANAALALREASDRSVNDPTSGLALRMGIDTGIALGSPVGREHRCYNLCGIAARRAAEMAQSAPPGGVQVTASAYRLLVGEFLFRPRGGFYMHPEGETATYLLAGRL